MPNSTTATDHVHAFTYGGFQGMGEPTRDGDMSLHVVRWHCQCGADKLFRVQREHDPGHKEMPSYSIIGARVYDAANVPIRERDGRTIRVS